MARIPSFPDLLARMRAKEPLWKPPERLMTFDPGGTTGWCLWLNGVPHLCGQVDGTYEEVVKRIRKYKPTVVVAEEYVLYPNKAKEQAWSKFPEVRLLGVIEYYCLIHGIEYHEQGANDKEFCSDVKLQHWGFWQNSQPHANDAIRHACYFLLFGPKRTAHNKARNEHQQSTPGGLRD